VTCPVDEGYVEAVLSLVEHVPAGRVTTYGDLAAVVGRGGPRQVGQVMARWGGGVPWWRVVRADGRPARGLEAEALSRLAAEDAPVRDGRVDLTLARFPLSDELIDPSHGTPDNFVRVFPTRDDL
jgi:alkylated DNA nucleotide flippase Atl1